MLRLAILMFSVFFFSSCALFSKVSLDDNDPYIWLEDIEGKKSLEWVEQQNQTSLNQLTQSERYKTVEDQALKILQNNDKIPYVTMMGEHLYNFWQDDKNVRGLWRRTTVSSYRQKKPQWETVLDLDELAKTENENWVYEEAQCLGPAYVRCLVSLSRGGKDAAVVREFDLKKKQFIMDGFTLPEAKSSVAWLNDNEIFVSTDYGPGSLTESGYPRVVKVWKRGTKLTDATTVYTGDVKDMVVHGYTLRDSQSAIHLVSQRTHFFSSREFVYSNGQLSPLPIPNSAQIQGYFREHLLLELREDWSVNGLNLKKGALVAVHQRVVTEKKVTGNDVQLIHSPTERSSLLSVAVLKNQLLLNVLDTVKGRFFKVTFAQGRFARPKAVPTGGQSHVTLSASSVYSPDFFYKQEDFLKPDALYLVRAGRSPERIKTLAPQFTFTDMKVEQFWAKSKDGEAVPYFIMGRKKVFEQKNNPTLLYGYGGFEVSITPSYRDLIGKFWLEKDGLYVIANIRGGGEFGPRWHQAALQKKRQKAYDDFIAVAEDLIKKGLTSPQKLAIQGGSNGGLLMGAMLTQRPDLFRSVLCHVPLLDMIRYSQLLAGASWMAEYGDPRDPEMNAFLRSYSPYHNVKEGVKYPDLFLITSTKDDRVHPGHARKMAAKMADQGHKNLLYYENTEGGHAAAANLKQAARMRALTFEFLYQTLMQ